jgi:dolichyl-phosphate beta-glucosyltransferase
MKSDRSSISIVVPAYNERRRILRTLRALIEYVKRQQIPIEIIVVDDGSTDSTREIVRAEMEHADCLRLVENTHSGKSYTLRTGFLVAKGRYTVQVDADLSTPPEEFSKLISALDDGYDVAIGWRSGRPGSAWYRVAMSIVWRCLVRWLLNQGFHDTQCGFKAYRTTSLHAILKQTRLYSTPEASLRRPSVSAASDVEMLMIAGLLGLRITEIPVEWHQARDSKVSVLYDSWTGLRDLVKLVWYRVSGVYSARAEGRSVDH